MASNINEKHLRNLLESIEKQLRYIDLKKQQNLLDVDLLLDKIKQFYEQCLFFRQEIEQNILIKKHEAEKANANMLSLFEEDLDEEITTKKQQKTQENKSSQFEEKTKNDTEEQLKEEFSIEKVETIELKQDEPSINLNSEKNTENQFVESENLNVEHQQEEDTENDENQTNEEDIQKEISNVEVEIEQKNIENNDFSLDASFFDIDSEEQQNQELSAISSEKPSHQDIDLDNIEFEEDEQLLTQEHVSENKSILENRAPAYWGDEIDIENPIPVNNISIGDSYKQTRPSVNDMVADIQNNETLGLKIGHGHSSDLMNNIDINNKFLFVKELFHNNGSLFTEEINHLNSFKKLKDMYPYLEQLKNKYHWKEDSEAYQELYKLLLRKFANPK